MSGGHSGREREREPQIEYSFRARVKAIGPRSTIPTPKKTEIPTTRNGVFRAAMMHPPQTMAGQGLFAPRIVMEMVPSATDKIQIILDAHGNKMDELRFEAQSARRDARRTFMGHNFSQASFDQSLDRVKSADGALEAEVLKIMSETVAKLTPEERRAFVEKIKEHNHSWWRHLGMGHDH